MQQLTLKDIWLAFVPIALLLMISLIKRLEKKMSNSISSDLAQALTDALQKGYIRGPRVDIPFERTCENCKHAQDAHDGYRGKCLFGPGDWKGVWRETKRFNGGSAM